MFVRISFMEIVYMIFYIVGIELVVILCLYN